MRLTVLGAGKLARLAAAHAAFVSGQPVGLSDPEVVTPGEHAEIAVTTLAGGAGTARLAGTDQDWLARTDCFLVVSDATTLVEWVAEHADWLVDRSVLLAPGNYAGVARVLDWYAGTGRQAPRIGELPGFPVVGGLDGRDVVIRGVKAAQPCGSIRGGISDRLRADFAEYLPDLVNSNTVLTGLTNINNVVHPPVVLANLSAIDQGRDLLFYTDGLSPGVAEVIRSIDAERRAVCRAVGVADTSIEQLFHRCYVNDPMRGDTLEEMLPNFPAFVRSQAPQTLRYRYVTDDVGHGLAGVEALARRLDVAAPTITALVTLLSAASGLDLRAAAEASTDLLTRMEDVRVGTPVSA
jgi:hypothetical protein